MKFKPYPFQQVAIDHAVQFLASAQRGQRQLYAAPTGCGKSVIELLVQQRTGAWIVTPREEIVDGMMEKLGVTGDMLDHRIATPVRLRNRLMDGSVRHPEAIIFDEGHHHSAETWQQLDLLTGMAPSVAYTATPYRGSPKGTKDFLDFWGEPIWLISYEEAVAEGYVRMPTFSVLPLVDDDIVEVTNGEFSVESIDSATVDRLGDMAEHARAWYNGSWDKPTVFAMPSTKCCLELRDELSKRGMPCAVVASGTSKADRHLAFQATTQRVTALLHINIVTEGVDFPFSRMVDMAPTMSPVKWVQQLGRVTRPTAVDPEYIGTNRNLLRHAYILEGVVPQQSVIEAQKVFPGTTRGHGRVVGLEAIGRFKPTSVKLRDGLTAHLYSLSTVIGLAAVEFCCIVHPTRQPVWAMKLNDRTDPTKPVYGSWRRCEQPTSLQGFASVSPRELSPKQKAWWDRSAAHFGLDPEQNVDRKSFQALPVLADIGEFLR